MKADVKAALDAKAKEAAETKAALAAKTNALAAKTAEMENALAYKTEELDDSQEIIHGQEEEIDDLKELIRKLQVDLRGMEVMFMFVKREEEIDVDELWNRTMAYVAATHHSVDEALDFAVKQYTLP